MHTRHLWVAAAMLIAHFGCASPSPTAPPLADRTPEPVIVDDFSVQLQTFTLLGSRKWPTSYEGGTIVNELSLRLSIIVLDERRNRVFRLDERSRVSHVADEHGNAVIIDPRLRPPPHPSASEFHFPGEDHSGRGPIRVLNQSFRLHRVPSAISVLAGEAIVHVVAQDEDVRFDIPDIGESYTLMQDLTATVTAKSIDAESGLLRHLSFELNSPLPVGASPATSAPVIHRVEILDDEGGVLGTLRAREVSSVGSTLRRRYTYMLPARNTPGRADRPARSIHVRALPQVDVITIPFQWGPIDLSGAPAH